MSSHIYLGPWINWSRGPILGATITLSQRNGGLLTAFIATFVTVVGSQLWKVVAYIFHQAKSSAKDQDGLHFQQQVILRNEATPAGAAWKFLQQSWYWRKKANMAILRTLPLSIFSVLFLGLFGVLAIFSSEISKAPGAARLIIGDQCGIWRLTQAGVPGVSAWDFKSRVDTQSAALYAQECYDGKYDPLQCSQYPVSSIDWTPDQNATCPFESGTCLYGDTAAYQITSRMIDSHTDLGINTPRKYRLQYQKITTCAPLHTKGFANIVNGSTEDSLGRDGDTIILYNYGAILNTDGSIMSNWSLQYNEHATIDNIGYTLESFAASPGGTNAWQPIPALNRTDADLSIVFISANSLDYSQPNSDPVFGANQENDPLTRSKFWTPDALVSVVACAEQHKICNPVTGACTAPLDASGAFEAAGKQLDLNDIQQGVAVRLLFGFSVTSVYNNVFTRKQNALLAQSTVSSLTQGALPNNQWMLELGSWFNVGLARMQHVVQEYASGPTAVVNGSYVWQPDEAVFKAMCYSQLLNDSSGTVSFSVLGLVILFVVGGLIILASFTVDMIVGFIQKRFNTGLHARTSWLVDDKLQIQRSLFQELGKGSWTTSVEEFPTTMERTKFNCEGRVDSRDGEAGEKGEYTRVSVTEQSDSKA